jgi:hypothetical protein
LPMGLELRVSTPQGTPVAWMSELCHPLAWHPSHRIFAGARENYLCLMKIEGSLVQEKVIEQC